jgi:hypothetical protein
MKWAVRIRFCTDRNGLEWMKFVLD